MESTPLTPEDDDEDKESSKSRKKDAKALGAFAVEPKATEQPERPREGLLGLFSRESNKDKSAENETEAVETEETAPLDNLSELERQVIEQQFIAERLHATPEPEDTPAITEAIDGFHHKVLDQGQSSDQALFETLDEVSNSEASSENDEAESVEQAQEDSSEEQAAEPIFETPIMEFSDEPIVIERDDSTPPTIGNGRYIPAPPRPSAPAEATPSTTRETDNGAAAGFLAGGAVGYLIGRRRGRIRTEKRLMPIQQKLEKQVEDLQANIVAKEMAIRQAVRQRELSPDVPQQRRSQRQESLQPLQAAELVAQSGAEMRQAVLSTKPEQLPPVPQMEIAPAIPVGSHVETMRRQDVLELAEKIQIENTTLKRVFESHLISEKGLRRVIAEHLRGGDVIKALSLEMTEHQIDFERDPQLRDHTPQQQIITAQPTLDDLLAQANIPTDYEHMHRVATAQAQEQHQQIAAAKPRSAKRAADIAMVTVITVLALLVIGLVILRR